MNRSQRRKAQRQAKRQGKPQGMTYGDQLRQNQMVQLAINKAARDDTVYKAASEWSEDYLWLMILSMHDAFGIGKKRLKRFSQCLHDRSAWYQEMREKDGKDYACGKIREEASRISGESIRYQYAHEIMESGGTEAAE